MAGGVSGAMNARRFLRAIDTVSYWSGKFSAWLIVALTFVVSLEVFKRYILNAPTAWIFDFKDRKSTRLNSSHGYISYAVFCLKKKKKKQTKYDTSCMTT